jgi:hypothetical protein
MFHQLDGSALQRMYVVIDGQHFMRYMSARASLQTQPAWCRQAAHCQNMPIMGTHAQGAAHA